MIIGRLLLVASLASLPCLALASEDGDYPQRLAALVNEYRVRHGLRALAVDATIGGLAREHSAAMAKAGKLDHDGFPGRVRRSGLAMCVENVGWNYASPHRQFEGWRVSPGHDANMLDPRVDRIGIGAVDDYVTMIACGR
jgi:uncharacterized protein YkwD